MNYIDKSTHVTEGTTIIDQLLDKNWVVDENYYSNIDYKNGLCDKRETYYQDLSNILLENQSNTCCYCMKEIEHPNTTLEHIIPQGVTCRNDFNAYTINTPELLNNVIFKKDFDKNNKIIPPSKYPHDIAYHNLIISCDSKRHCNNGRGDYFIRPFMYDSNIASKVEYLDSGIAGSEEYGEELAAVGISTNTDLGMYRKIWKELASLHQTIPSITEEAIDEVILSLKEMPNFEKYFENFYGVPSKKTDLLTYKWFFNYYKNKP